MSAEDTRESLPKLVREPLPQSVGDMFVSESARAKSSPNHLDERNLSFLTVYHKPETVPGAEGAALKINYGYDRTEKELPSFIDFEYVSAPTAQRPYEKEIALMNLLNLGGNTFDVYHRIVHEEKARGEKTRGQGIGTQLMSRVEEWATQVATASGSPVTLTASINQKEVLLDFFTDKFNYQPVEEHRALFDELKAHIDDPTKFKIIGERHTIYRVDDQGRPHLHPVEVRVEKIFPPLPSPGA